MTTLEQLAASGRLAWRMMMRYVNSKLWDYDDPYRVERIEFYNKFWNNINQQIRDHKYEDNSSS